MSNIIELKLAPLKEYISVARYTSCVFANSMGFDYEKIEDIKLVVGEACNNAVLYGDVNHNELFIRFYDDGNSFFIEIKDRGYGFDVDKYKNPDLDKPDEGGFGIYIMKKLADDLSIKSDKENGTVLSIRFDLK